jgi:Holliday junction resolvase RusA-like endonuclease
MSERADRRWTESELATAMAKNGRAPDSGTSKADYPSMAPERRVEHLTLVLPWPPSVNHMYRPGAAHGSRILTDEAKSFRSAVQVLAWQLGRPWLEGPIEMRLDLHPPSRRGDIDNVAKLVLDSLQHAGFYENDRMVDILILQRHASKTEPAIAVTLESIERTT